MRAVEAEQLKIFCAPLNNAIGAIMRIVGFSVGWEPTILEGAYAACSQRACAGCSMCVYADFQSALSPISPSLRSSCPRCSESMGERHWAHAWAQAVVGVLQSSRHLGRHCRVQHQQPQIAANSVHRFHPHLDSTPSKRAEGYHDGIPGVAGGATEPTQTPRGPFSEVMVKTTFDLVTSSTKTPD